MLGSVCLQWNYTIKESQTARWPENITLPQCLCGGAGAYNADTSKLSAFYHLSRYRVAIWVENREFTYCRINITLPTSSVQRILSTAAAMKSSPEWDVHQPRYRSLKHRGGEGPADWWAMKTGLDVVAAVASLSEYLPSDRQNAACMTVNTSNQTWCIGYVRNVASERPSQTDLPS